MSERIYIGLNPIDATNNRAYHAYIGYIDSTGKVHQLHGGGSVGAGRTALDNAAKNVSGYSSFGRLQSVVVEAPIASKTVVVGSIHGNNLSQTWQQMIGISYSINLAHTKYDMLTNNSNSLAATILAELGIPTPPEIEMYIVPGWRLIELQVYENLPAPQQCFVAGTPISMWDGTKKPIERVHIDDWVVGYDGHGNLKPGRVKRTFKNSVKIILDFHGTFVTPGHVYFCAGGKYKGQHVPLLDILLDDGVVQQEDGTLIRATTGCELGSENDTEIWAFLIRPDKDGTAKIRDKRLLRLGTRSMLSDGSHFSVREYMHSIGIELIADGEHAGYVRHKSGRISVFEWTLSERLPKAEDFILQRSQTSLEDIYRAGQWEDVLPEMPAPLLLKIGRAHV